MKKSHDIWYLEHSRSHAIAITFLEIVIELHIKMAANKYAIRVRGNTKNQKFTRFYWKIFFRSKQQYNENIERHLVRDWLFFSLLFDAFPVLWQTVMCQMGNKSMQLNWLECVRCSAGNHNSHSLHIDFQLVFKYQPGHRYRHSIWLFYVY